MSKTEILVVEDDPSTQFLMSEMLGSLGHECDVAPDGFACLERLERQPGIFDLILMDLHMPRRSGLEVSKDIRAIQQDPPRGLPIVAVTADSNYRSLISLAPYGFDDVLPKPVDLNRLGRMIERNVAT